MSMNQNQQTVLPGPMPALTISRKEADADSFAVAALIGLVVGLIVAFVLPRSSWLTLVIVALIATWIVAWFIFRSVFPAAYAYYSSGEQGASHAAFDIVAIIIGILAALFFSSVVRKAHECAGFAPVAPEYEAYPYPM